MLQAHALPRTLSTPSPSPNALLGPPPPQPHTQLLNELPVLWLQPPGPLTKRPPPSPSLSITPPSQRENMNNGPGTGKKTLGLEPDEGKSLNGGSGLFVHRKQGHRRSRKAHRFLLKGQRRREPALSEPRALPGRAHGSQGPRGPGTQGVVGHPAWGQVAGMAPRAQGLLGGCQVSGSWP